jgi:hypothetical protein
VKGWPAVIVIVGLAVVVLVGLNVGMYRRMKAASAAGRARGVADGETPSGRPDA